MNSFSQEDQSKLRFIKSSQVYNLEQVQALKEENTGEWLLIEDENLAKVDQPKQEMRSPLNKALDALTQKFANLKFTF